MIYADNAATTRLSEAALEKMLPWLRDGFGNASQPYFFGTESKKALDTSREIIAECINAQPDEIFFTSGGTESDNWAIKGYCNPRKNGIVTSEIEHHALLRSCDAKRSAGYEISYASPNSCGVIEATALSEMIKENTGLVSVMYANNEIGTVQNIPDLCRIAHGSGAIFHTDAVQAVGHIKIDVKESEIDMLSASAHKFNGPKGIGFLYIKRGTKINPHLDGGSQEMGKRAGTENVAAAVGMAQALRENCEKIDENTKKLRFLQAKLIDLLNDSRIVYRQNGGENTLPGLLSLSFPGEDGEGILHCMDLAGICISTGSACDSVNTRISHVLRAIGLEESAARGTVRISLGKDNTEDEVEEIFAALKRVLI